MGFTGCSAVWLAHLVWDQRVVGSNPITPIFHKLSGRRGDRTVCEKSESRGEKVESRNSPSDEVLHGFLVVKSPSYLLPSTRSTLYSVISTLSFLLSWPFGLFAYSRLLERDGRWTEVEPVRDRLIKECRKQGKSKPYAQAWIEAGIPRENHLRCISRFLGSQSHCE